jgi:hypothetical protein
VSLRGPPFGPKQSPSAESEIASVAALLRNDDFATAPNPRQDCCIVYCVESRKVMPPLVSKSRAAFVD